MTRLPPRPQPRVLVLTPKVPAGGISGDRIRNYHLIRSLHEAGWAVRLFTLWSGDERDRELLKMVAEYCEAVEPFRDGTAMSHRVRMATAILLRQAFHRRLFASRAGISRLRGWTQDVPLDAVLVEQLHMFPYVQERWRPITVLDSHNDEASRIDGIASIGGSWLRRALAGLQRKPVRAYEDAAVASAALTLAVSPLELKRFDLIAPNRAALVPNGVNIDAVQPMAQPPDSRDIVFVGSLDYSANVDAVRYFARDIAPRLRSVDSRFVVVGSNPPRGLANTIGDAIETQVLGYVADLDRVMRSARVVVVPLRRGGGTRLKVLEAMARGIPVVSTSIGCAGLEMTSEQELLIADEPEQFAAAIERLLDDDRLWMDVSRRARHRVESGYDWRAIGRQLDEILERLILRSGSRRT